LHERKKADVFDRRVEALRTRRLTLNEPPVEKPGCS
jgi:hypothetical protein